MKIYTIGFTQKSAQDFFELLKNNNVDIVIDIRLNNASQLAGFAKGKDLKYFLNKICDCEYDHNVLFAPTKDLLDAYRNKKITWVDYERDFSKIMSERSIVNDFKNKYKKYKNVCLLCTEPTPNQCHRRLVAEFIKNSLNDVEIVHI